MSVTPPGGNTTAVFAESGSEILDVRRSYQQGSDTVTESYLYDFLDSGAHAGHMERVTLRRRINSGAWTNILKVEYAYYGSSDSHGGLNDLKTATRHEWSGGGWTSLDTSYYRYWKEGDAKGSAHLLKYVVGPEAFVRLEAAVSNPFTASDATVAQYADNYYEYNADRFATKEITDGGSREFSFAYSLNPNYNPSQPRDFNFWMRKTVETLPDGTRNIVFCNAVGMTMLKIVESGTDRWLEFNRFDDEGRGILSASSSAVSGYDEDLNDLLAAR